MKHMPRVFTFAGGWLGCAMALLGSGCVVHVHDASTGVDTLYGIGVMRVRAVPPGSVVQASGLSVETAGLALNWGADDTGFTFGYDKRQRMRIFETATPLELEYSAGDFWRGEVRVVPRAAPAAPPVSSPTETDPDAFSNPPKSKP